MHRVVDWVIYGLRLRTETKYRYVGQTQFGAAYRLRRHRHMSKYRDYPVCMWLRKHDDVVIDVLERVPVGDLQVLDAREVEWIARLRGRGHDLLNCDDGGRSMYTQTEIARQKRVRSGKDHYNYGKHHSEETRKKLSAARKLRVTTEETKAKMSESSKGVKNHNSKLTPDDVREIRRLAPTMSGVAIAAQFGITSANVSSILKRKTWKHIV